MKTLLVHLTDIHLCVDIDFKDNKLKGIIDSINSKKDIESVIFVVSGDLAARGESSQFENAKRYLDQIKKGLRHRNIKFCFCPGNHDRYFESTEKISKEEVLELDENNFTSKLEKANLRYKNYYDLILPYSRCKKINDILYEYSFELCDKKFKIYALNNALFSAYKSGNDDDANFNNIFIKSDYLKIERGNYDYVFLAQHFPLSYYRKKTFNAFEQYLSSKVDLVFSGHIHTPIIHDEEKENGRIIEITSKALDSSNSSGFSLVILDDTKVSIENYVFDVQTNQYNCEPIKTKHLNKVLQTAYFNQVNDEMVNRITSTSVFDGEAFFETNLDTFFVFPQLSLSRYTNNSSVATYETFLSKIKDNDVIKITGSSKSGKTTLLRYLFNKFRKNGFVPVICKANDILDVDKDVFSIFKSNYSLKGKKDDFLTIPKNNLVLLIDQQEVSSTIFFNNLLKYFGKIILTSPEGKDFISSDEDNNYNFIEFYLEPFYLPKRIKLYEKIFNYFLNKDPDILEDLDSSQFQKEVENKLEENDFENSIDPNTLIPLAISILKKRNYSLSLKTPYAKLKLDYLLTKNLKDRGYNCTTNIALDILSYVAMQAYQRRINEFDIDLITESINHWHSLHSKKRIITNDVGFVGMLADIKILKSNNKGFYSFASRSIFAFLVGRYAMIEKNSKRNDDSYLLAIVKNGIYVPLNFQILLSIASNYDYRAIPDFIVDCLYNDVMKEPSIEQKDLNAYLKSFDDNNSELKDLVDFNKNGKNKRNEVRMRIGKEEEKIRKLSVRHKDDYFYCDLSKKLYLKINDLGNKAIIIQTLLNNFADIFETDVRDRLCEMVVRLPYAIINSLMKECFNKLDVLYVKEFDALTQANRGSAVRVSYEQVKKAINGEIMATILAIFDMTSRIIRNPLIVDSVQEFIEMQNNNLEKAHRIMLKSFSTDRDGFVDEVKSALQNTQDKFAVSATRLIGCRFCYDNYDWVQQYHSEFFNTISKVSHFNSNSFKEQIKKKTIKDKRIV